MMGFANLKLLHLKNLQRFRLAQIWITLPCGFLYFWWNLSEFSWLADWLFACSFSSPSLIRSHLLAFFVHLCLSMIFNIINWFCFERKTDPRVLTVILNIFTPPFLILPSSHTANSVSSIYQFTFADNPSSRVSRSYFLTDEFEETLWHSSAKGC